ncbi:MAG: RsmD family RNA methyltransferase [Holosporaceae bacterium]|jgi:16S rRNA (guanine966-N2)-methyltransferase|nr:RsmD family RNA methyltransferase [Holosporaceae bacterium]
MIRIISGKFKGISIDVPDSARPTLSRRRQSLFDMLEAMSPGGNGFFKEKTVLDCFAGSGAFGLEAISRGAFRAYFVDFDAKAISLIRLNLIKMKTEDISTIIHSDILKLRRCNRREAVDLAFMDPPYGEISILKTLEHLIHTGWISEKTILVTEEDSRKTENFCAYHEITSKTIGNTVFKILNCTSINTTK